MWPFEFLGGRETLRVGRHVIERWVEVAGGLSLASSQSLPEEPRLDTASLASTLQALYPTPSAAAITVVLESIWLPLVLAEVGPALWKPAQVKALMQHRLNLAHGQAVDSASSWDLRVNHLAGERFALGYGLHPSLKQSFVEAGKPLGLKWAALLPSFASRFFR